MKPYEPNVKFPLANSYNTRGIAGYTNAITNGLDQRKINMVYRPVVNAMTGKTTLYLCKRPGTVIDGGGNSFGTSGQVAYLTSLGAALFGSGVTNSWVYSVSGNDVRASSSATTTVVVTSAGSIPLYVDKTSIGGSDTVVLQVGTDPTAQTVWYSTAIATFTQITDGDFPDTIGKMEFIDGYAFAALDSTAVQRIYNSDLNSLSSWTATNYITKQIQQDKLVGLMRLGNLIIGPGQNTLEVFRDAGNTVGSPLESIQQLAKDGGVDINCNGPYYCRLGGKLYYYGRSGSTNSISINVFDGSTVSRVSTPAIEAILNEAATRRAIQAINFQGRTAVSVSLANQNAATQMWLMFFPDYNEWFEWTSTVVSPIQNEAGWFLGVGSNQHKLYDFVSANTWQDNATDFNATVQFYLPTEGNQRKVMRFLGLQGDTPSSAFTFTINKKDNDESSWQALGTLDMTSPNKQITSCGSWIGQRQIQIINGSNNEGRVTMFLARIE